MKRQLIRLTAVGTMAAGMIFAQAQTAPPAAQGQTKAQPEHARSQRFEAHRRMMQALNLTADQKTMAKSIFGQAREASKPVRMELRQNRQAMAVAVKSDNQAEIAKLSGERGKLMAKLTTNRADAMAKFYQALTPAQRAKADQMQARFQARIERWHSERRATRTNG